MSPISAFHANKGGETSRSKNTFAAFEPVEKVKESKESVLMKLKSKIENISTGMMQEDLLQSPRLAS
jgi:hypothetical protein